MRLFGKGKPPVVPAAAAPTAAARLAPDSTPLAPSIEQQLAELFDSRWYLETNPDVAGAALDALTHFMAYGEAEGRDPNPTFSTRFYRETFMQGEPAGASPVLHYLKQGRDLGYDTGNLVNYWRIVAAQEQSYGL
jgi:hypothetical protein